jgi:Tol biopolymer transport system component
MPCSSIREPSWKESWTGWRLLLRPHWTKASRTRTNLVHPESSRGAGALKKWLILVIAGATIVALEVIAFVLVERHRAALEPTFTIRPDYLAGPPARLGSVSVNAELLYTVPDDAEWKGETTIDPTGTRWACVCRRGKQEFVALDGEGQQPYDRVRCLTFSPDGSRFAYTAESGGSESVVLDGAKLASYDSVSRPDFSPDGKRLAYGAVSDGTEFIVLDGIEQRSYNKVHLYYFSPDGKRFIYGAESDGKHFVIVDGTEEGPYEDDVYPMTFSPDGSRYAYVVRHIGPPQPDGWPSDHYSVVVDGTEQERFDRVGEPVFTSDGNHFAYAAKAGREWFIVLDGHKRRVETKPEWLTWSPRGSRLAYTSEQDWKEFVVVDWVRQKSYDFAGGFEFSPDGKHYAYAAASGSRQFVVLDGTELKPYERVGDRVFSPDGRRLAYVAEEHGDRFVVMDGTEGRRYAEIWDLVFSADGKSLAYEAGQALRSSYVVGHCVVVNDTELAGVGLPIWLSASATEENAFVWFSWAGETQRDSHGNIRFRPGGKFYRFTAW